VERRLSVLETYFVKPSTVDRIRASWIGSEVERYADWMAEEGYSTRCILSRVPLLVAFGEFARARGVSDVANLGSHVEAFVAERVSRFRRVRADDTVAELASKEIRGPVEQMLDLIVPDFEVTGRRRRANPFLEEAPRFFEYLVSERGLRPASAEQYRFHLDRFQGYLTRVGVQLPQLSTPVLTAFVAERSAAGLAKTTVRDCCGVLRVFVRYAYREGVLGSDLSNTVEWPQVYRLSSVPRSISWEEVGKVLAGVDRRTPCGRRDYAILLLLVTYGLRAREVAALTLDDIDWKHERLAVPERKAGHSTAFPLSRSVGEALLGGRGASRLPAARPSAGRGPTRVLPCGGAVAPHRPSGDLFERREIPCTGRGERSSAWFPHPASHAGATPRRQRLLVEDDW
jgi:integrase/recombinase XerD